MPGWSWHIHLANEVANKIDVKNREEFLLGSTLPDTPWLSYEQAVLSSLRPQLHNYIYKSKCLYAEADATRWLRDHIELVRNYDMWKGALTHVILDQLLNSAWNLCCSRLTYDNYRVHTQSGMATMSPQSIRHEAAAACEAYEANLTGTILKTFAPTEFSLSESAKRMLYTEFSITDLDLSLMCNSIKRNIVKERRAPRDNMVLTEEQYDEINDNAVWQSVHLLNLCMLEED